MPYVTQNGHIKSGHMGAGAGALPAHTNQTTALVPRRGVARFVWALTSTCRYAIEGKTPRLLGGHYGKSTNRDLFLLAP
jgi:hypothetical protein